MPQLDAMDLFVTAYQMTAMALDSTELSVPIVTNVSTVTEIDSAFNRLTYTKGNSRYSWMVTDYYWKSNERFSFFSFRYFLKEPDVTQ